MYLIDSNIIIYSYSDQYKYLRSILIDDHAYVSEISRVEVLGYHKLLPEEESYFSDIFKLNSPISLSQKVFDQAIILRKAYNMKLGDALIAATALVHDLILYTRNLSDFELISGLKCINPIK